MRMRSVHEPINDSRSPSLRALTLKVTCALFQSFKFLLTRVVPPSSFRRNSLLLILGTLAAQGIGIAAVPFITRLYTPTQLGLLGSFVGITGIITPLACLNYAQAIMLPKRDTDATQLAKLSIILSLGIAMVSVGVVAVWGQAFAQLIKLPELASWLWAIPPLILLTGLLQISQVLHSRRKAFAAISVAKISQSVVMATTQVGCGVAFVPGVWGLLTGYVASLVTQVVVLVGVTKTAWCELLSGTGTVGEMWGQAKRHRKFALLSTPGSVAINLGSQGFVLIVAILFGSATAGIFFVTHRALSLPVSVVSQSMSPAFYERLAAARQDGEDETGIIAQTFLALLALAVVPAILLAMLAPWLFEIVFGAGWAQAGQFARAMICKYVMLFSVFPITQAFYVYEKQHYGLAWHLGLLVVTISTTCVCGILGGPLAGVVAYAVSGAMMYGLVVVMALGWSGCPLRGIPSAFLVAARRMVHVGVDSVQ